MLICDLAETYHIIDYRSLSPSRIATFVAGLRDDSRLVQKSCGVKASQQNLLQAHIVDKLSLILKCLADMPYESMVNIINGVDDSNKSNVMAFDSNEDFATYWAERNGG